MVKLTDVINERDIKNIKTFMPDFDENKTFDTDDEWDEFVEEMIDFIVPYLNTEKPTREAELFDDVVYKMSIAEVYEEQEGNE
ncbi:MAG: hypothetical protein ACK5LM_07005 [Lactovum sp.]